MWCSMIFVSNFDREEIKTTPVLLKIDYFFIQCYFLLKYHLGKFLKSNSYNQASYDDLTGSNLNFAKSVKYGQPLILHDCGAYMVSFCSSNTNKNSPQTDIKLYKGILVEAYIHHFV